MKRGASLALAMVFLSAAAVAEDGQDTARARGTAVVAARHAAQPIRGEDGDYDGLLEAIGDARIVMLGEASHGSREFYRERARITRRLIAEKAFSAVVLEAAWEPVRRLDQYVLGGSRDSAGAQALGDFKRFPRWMWRNREVVAFLEDLRALNAARAGAAPPVRLYGMDLYSVPESARAVVAYLAASDPRAAEAAERRYGCFRHYLREPQLYGRAVVVAKRRSCEAGARDQLAELKTRVDQSAAPDEALFLAWQSARVAADGEAYYRAMYVQGSSAWNVREQRLAATIEQLRQRTEALAGGPARIVVWAHNIHQGDARETDQAVAGEISIGQRMRERFGQEVALVGFSTYTGKLRAASDWGEPDRIWTLRPAYADSWSGLLHQVGLPAFALPFRNRPELAEAFAASRLERAVGVSYVPADERASHYFHVRLSRQFDAVIHLDVTTPVEPLP